MIGKRIISVNIGNDHIVLLKNGKRKGGGGNTYENNHIDRRTFN